MRIRSWPLLWLLPLLAGLLAAADAAESNPVDARTRPGVTRLIVQWRADTGVGRAALATRRAHLQQRAGSTVRAARALGTRIDLMALGEKLSGTALQKKLATLRADPAIASVQPDKRVFAHAAAPSDARFAAGSDSIGSWEGQWYLGAPSSTLASSINALGAWDTTEGLGTMVVAVVDTGADFTHEDLLTYGSGGKLLPGYDFISCDTGAISCTADDTYNSSHDCTVSTNTCTLVANDGDGWDSDPTDPGDAITSTDLARSDGFFKGCGSGDNKDQPEPSSWHGTRVAGIIGALTNNGIGVAGVAPNALVLPVRVLGKCGGYIADVIDGMRWAAGLSVTDAPSNPYPARVINLSLGSSEPCSSAEQSAIDEIIAAGVVVVASAGNDGGPLNSPANCKGVLSVAGLRHNGEKVGYSSVSGTSTPVSIGAPAGNCGDSYTSGTACLYSIETTTNEGSTTPSTGSFYTYAVFNSSYSGNSSNEASVGTSFSAPQASGVAALMLSVNSSLTPAQLIARMQAKATAFPTSTRSDCAVRDDTALDSSGYYTDVPSESDSVACHCTMASCGAGMLNAQAAVQAATGPVAAATSSESKASIGDKVTLSASGSSAADGHSIVSYHWSTDPSVSISGQGTASAWLYYPSTRPMTVTLTVTDDAGLTDSTTLSIDGAVAAGTHYGGGALGRELPVLALLAGWLVLRRRRRAAG